MEEKKTFKEKFINAIKTCWTKTVNGIAWFFKKGIKLGLIALWHGIVWFFVGNKVAHWFRRNWVSILVIVLITFFLLLLFTPA